MKERPILFSNQMAQAIAELHKTQTRRTRGLEYINTNPAEWNVYGYVEDGRVGFKRNHVMATPIFLRCPYGVPDDRLWVREAWIPDPPIDGSWDSCYEWNGCGRPINGVPKQYQSPNHCIYKASWSGTGLVWRPSIHMPRWASRTLLEITDVIPQRIQDMTDADALAEGIKILPITGTGACHCLYTIDDIEVFETALKAYRHLFRTVNHQKGGKDTSWARNDWVWKITFKVLENKP
jgi:hypothetical protein